MRLVILFVFACGSSTPPPAIANKPVPADAAPPDAAKTVAFGRYRVALPPGYTTEARTDNISFERAGVMQLFADGGDQTPPQPAKCIGLLQAFASGVVTGLMGIAVQVDVVAGNPLPNGCRFGGKAGTGFVEAAVMEIGGSLAFAILLREKPDEAALVDFDRLVKTVVKP